MERFSKHKTICLLIYLICAAILVLFSVEVLVRLLGIAPPLVTQYSNYVSDPHLPFKPKPFSKLTGRSSSDEYNFEYAHNSLGFRDIEHSLEKPKGTFRILALGDSFTYGVGAAIEETWTYRLEEMLNHQKGDHPKVEIIKAGIPRYFPEPERLLLEHYGLDYKPDLILIGFVPNDIVDTSLGLDAVRVSADGYLIKASAFSEVASWLYVHSHVFRILYRQYSSIAQVESGNPDRLPTSVRVKAEEKIATEFTTMVALGNRIGARTVLIHIPEPGPWDEDAHRVPAKLSEWSSSNHLPFIDVLPTMEMQSPNQILYWKKDGHPNTLGYKAIAETIFSKLVENDLVP